MGCYHKKKVYWRIWVHQIRKHSSTQAVLLFRIDKQRVIVASYRTLTVFSLEMKRAKKKKKKKEKKRRFLQIK